ncbi:hypothetical protein UlMin_001273 [Ulmus minor]
MMKVSSFLHTLIALLVLLFCSHINCSSTGEFSNKTYTNYIKTQCNITIYPRLCYHSLSIYAENIKTNPKVLAHTALNLSLSATRRTCRVVKELSKIRGLKPREAGAVLDCVELIEDSVGELEKSMQELDNLGSSSFAFQINNIQTWVSAALTDDDTCTDGFAQLIDSEVKAIVRRRALKIGHLTSNSLALVNSYAASA